MRPIHRVFCTFIAVLLVAPALARAQMLPQPTIIPTGNWPIAIYAADLNQDSHPDLIYIDSGANPSASTTHILLNQGDGTFKPGQTLATAGTSIAVADFDGDGVPDLAWVSYSSSAGARAWLAKGDGAGGFAHPLSSPFSPGLFPVTGTNFTCVSAARLRDSGSESLVFGDTGSSVVRVMSFVQGVGFQQDAALPVTGTIESLHFVDVDTDGHLDIVVIGSKDFRLETFFGRGDGTLQISGRMTGGSGGPILSQLFAPMDGDGNVEYLTESRSGRLNIFRVAPDGTLHASSVTTPEGSDGTTGNGGHLIAVADLNGDGIADILASTPKGISVLLGTGSLHFKLGGIYNAGPGRASYVVADFNGDGHLDLAVDSPEGIAILFGNPDGSFQPSRLIPAGQPAYPLVLNPAANLLLSNTFLTNVVSPIHYGETIGNVAQGFAQPLAPGGPLLDGGNLNFLINGTVVCTLPYITGKSQVCPVTTGAGYSVGLYQLSSMYTGNQFYSPSTSVDYPVQILPDDTQGMLASSLNPALIATPVTFTALFSAPFATPAGTVTFFDGATPIGTGSLDFSGKAILSISTLAVGTHPITAVLAASLNFNSSSTGTLSQVIVPPPAATATLLSSSLNPSLPGQSVTFTATVVASGANAAPLTGTITFTIDGATQSAVSLTPQSTASFSISALAIGSHSIVATYSGTTATVGINFAPSVSATLTQLVNAVPAAPSFTLTATPTAISVPIGNSVFIPVTIAPLNGFNKAVTLSCGALPRGVLCVFNTDTIVNGNGTALLKVTVTAPHDCNSDSPYFIASGPTTWLGIFTTSGLILLARRRRKLAKSILLALALSILPGLTGCGHCTDLGVFPGNYTFNVTGTSSTPISETATQTIHMVAHL